MISVYVNYIRMQINEKGLSLVVLTAAFVLRTVCGYKPSVVSWFPSSCYLLLFLYFPLPLRIFRFPPNRHRNRFRRRCRRIMLGKTTQISHGLFNDSFFFWKASFLITLLRSESIRFLPVCGVSFPLYPLLIYLSL